MSGSEVVPADRFRQAVVDAGKGMSSRRQPRPNPFGALSAAHADLVRLHERLASVAESLTGPLPAFEPSSVEPGSTGGLLAVSQLTAAAMSRRLAHLNQLVDKLEEYLA